MLGVAVGAWLGRGMTSVYSQYFRFPEFQYFLSQRIAITGASNGGLLVGAMLTRALTESRIA